MIRVKLAVCIALLLTAAACATPGKIPHDPAPVARPDPGTCPAIAIIGPLQVQYPAKAFETGQEGWVHLRFDVDESGVATNVRQLGASPPGVFDVAARETLDKARFLTVNTKGCEFVVDYRKDAPK
jgi:TonB family protein